jgi:hypothetical protein
VWTSRSEKLPEARGLRFFIDLEAKPAAFADVLRGWQGDAAFRSIFNDLLAQAPFSAFHWETPPIPSATVTRPFEFVLLDSPELARRPNPEACAEHFNRSPEASVVEFSNLGGDATLIVPCLKTTPSAYGHLAAFVRQARLA